MVVMEMSEAQAELIKEAVFFYHAAINGSFNGLADKVVSAGLGRGRERHEDVEYRRDVGAARMQDAFLVMAEAADMEALTPIGNALFDIAGAFLDFDRGWSSTGYHSGPEPRPIIRRVGKAP